MVTGFQIIATPAEGTPSVTQHGRGKSAQEVEGNPSADVPFEGCGRRHRVAVAWAIGPCPRIQQEHDV